MSKYYVPDRMLKKIDQTTSSIMENGLSQFFSSFTAIKRKLIERATLGTVNDNEFQALSVEQLKRPMILLFGICAAATILLIAEIIIFRCSNR